MRSREQLMDEWDRVRRALREGAAHDSSTFWFEGVLDAYDEAVCELSALIDRALKTHE